MSCIVYNENLTFVILFLTWALYPTTVKYPHLDKFRPLCHVVFDSCLDSSLKVLAGFRNDLENPIQNVIYNLERAFSENALRDIYVLVKTVCRTYFMTFMTYIKTCFDMRHKRHKICMTNRFD